MPNPHDNWAVYYDHVYETCFGPMYTTLTNQILTNIRGFANAGAHLTDIGAGTGRLAIPLAEYGFRILAVEPSIAMLDVLKQKAAAANVKLDNANASMSTYESQPTDLAIAIFTVISYITDEDALHQSFSNLSANLKQGGLFYFDHPSRALFNNSVCKNHGVNREVNVVHEGMNLYTYTEVCNGVLNGNEFHYEDEFHIRYWEYNEVENALLARGFERVLTHTHNLAGATYYLFRKV